MLRKDLENKKKLLSEKELEIQRLENELATLEVERDLEMKKTTNPFTANRIECDFLLKGIQKNKQLIIFQDETLTLHKEIFTLQNQISSIWDKAMERIREEENDKKAKEEQTKAREEQAKIQEFESYLKIQRQKEMPKIQEEINRGTHLKNLLRIIAAAPEDLENQLDLIVKKYGAENFANDKDLIINSLVAAWRNGNDQQQKIILKCVNQSLILRNGAKLYTGLGAIAREKTGIFKPALGHGMLKELELFNNDPKKYIQSKQLKESQASKALSHFWNFSLHSAKKAVDAVNTINHVIVKPEDSGIQGVELNEVILKGPH